MGGRKFGERINATGLLDGNRADLLTIGFDALVAGTELEAFLVSGMDDKSGKLETTTSFRSDFGVVSKKPLTRDVDGVLAVCTYESTQQSKCTGLKTQKFIQIQSKW